MKCRYGSEANYWKLSSTRLVYTETKPSSAFLLLLISLSFFFSSSVQMDHQSRLTSQLGAPLCRIMSNASPHLMSSFSVSPLPLSDSILKSSSRSVLGSALFHYQAYGSLDTHHSFLLCQATDLGPNQEV